MKSITKSVISSILVTVFILISYAPSGLAVTKSSVTVLHVDETGKEITTRDGDTWQKYYEEGKSGESYKGPKNDGYMGPVTIPGYTFVKTTRPSIVMKWNEDTCNGSFISGVNQTITHTYKKVNSQGGGAYIRKIAAPQNSTTGGSKTISSYNLVQAANEQASIESEDFALSVTPTKTTVANGQDVEFTGTFENKVDGINEMTLSFIPKDFIVTKIVIPSFSWNDVTYTVVGIKNENGVPAEIELLKDAYTTAENTVTADTHYTSFEIRFTSTSVIPKEEKGFIVTGHASMDENNSWLANLTTELSTQNSGSPKEFSVISQNIVVETAVLPNLNFTSDYAFDSGSEITFALDAFNISNNIPATKMNFKFTLPTNAKLKSFNVGEYTGCGAVKVIANDGALDTDITDKIEIDSTVINADNIPEGTKTITVDVKTIPTDVSVVNAPKLVFDTTDIETGTSVDLILDTAIYTADREEYATKETYTATSKCGTFGGNPAEITIDKELMVEEDFEVRVESIKNTSTLPVKNIESVVTGLEDTTHIYTGEFSGTADNYSIEYKTESQDWQILKDNIDITANEKIELPNDTTGIRIIITNPSNGLNLKTPLKICGVASSEAKTYNLETSTVALGGNGGVAFIGQNTLTFNTYVMDMVFDFTQSETNLYAGDTEQKYTISMSRNNNPFAFEDGKFVYKLDSGFSVKSFNLGSWLGYRGSLSVYVVKNGNTTKIGTYPITHNKDISLTSFGVVEQIIIECSHSMSGNVTVNNMVVTGIATEESLKGNIFATASFEAKFRDDEIIGNSVGPLTSNVFKHTEEEPAPTPPITEPEPTPPQDITPQPPQDTKPEMDLKVATITVSKGSVGYGTDVVLAIGNMGVDNVDGSKKYVLTVNIPQGVEVKNISVPSYGTETSVSVVYTNGSMELGNSLGAQYYSLDEMYSLNVQAIIITIGDAASMNAEGEASVYMKNISAEQVTAAITVDSKITDNQGNAIKEVSDSVEIILLSPGVEEPKEQNSIKEDKVESNKGDGEDEQDKLEEKAINGNFIGRDNEDIERGAKEKIAEQVVQKQNIGKLKILFVGFVVLASSAAGGLWYLYYKEKKMKSNN